MYNNTNQSNILLRSYGHSYLNAATGNVGIGTTEPWGKLTVSSGDLMIDHPQSNYFGASASSFSLLDNAIIFKYNNTDKHAEIRGAIPIGKHTTGIVFRTKSHYSQPYINSMFIHPDGNVGIGTTTPSNKLEVNGTIRSKEVKVEASPWPDFVFSKEHTLRPLKEVEAHIQQHGSLPEIPTAKEVEENGIGLGEMNAKLLQKIEELTLYTIEQQKDIVKLLKNSKKQNEIIERQNKRIEKLENLN